MPLPFDPLALLSLLLTALVLWRVMRRGDGDAAAALRLLLEQNLATQRAEAETTRRELAQSERALASRIEALRLEQREALHGVAEKLALGLAEGARGAAEKIEQFRLESREAGHALSRGLTQGQAEARLLMETKLREMGEQNATKLAELERQVNEQLHAAVEKQMESSFQRVIDQFNAVQKAMGDVQAVTAQIGDLRRVFSNVKTRGGWGETQLRALLDDMLPEGAYEMNRKLREGSDEVVEFVVHMPMKGDVRPLMAIDAKFPVEDYERLLNAAESGSIEEERTARRGLETRLRLEAKKIADKYIVPPVTVEFAVLYLPTDGLFAEVARIPGLIEEIGRLHKVLVLGPSLLPAMLRTIHLGFMTMALEQKTGEIRHLLGATRTEIGKMDEVLGKLAKNANAMGNSIEAARRRTRAVQRTLKGVEAVELSEATALVGEAEPVEEDEEE